MSNKFVLNADDFGMSNAFNRAVLEGFASGILKSTSLVANGEAFDEAVNEIIPKCEGLGVGIHLNIIEGKALGKDLEFLTDANGNFNNSFINLLINSYNRNSNVFLQNVEKEFRIQIEKILDKTKVSHIDSHVHVHSIPAIFEIVCKLAQEYGIKQIRTQFEYPYIIPYINKHLTLKYPVNLIKVALLNFFTLKNRQTVLKYDLNTNNYLIGVAYTSMMDVQTLFYGLNAIKNKDSIVAEALIHPCRYEDGFVDGHFTEYSITQNKKLKEQIEQLNFTITNYAEEA